MRIYKSFFRFEKCRKACKYRLYRLMRTYKEIVKNYILIYLKIGAIFLCRTARGSEMEPFFVYGIKIDAMSIPDFIGVAAKLMP